MYWRTLVVLLAFTCLFFKQAAAQQKYNRLKIGDTVSEYQLNNLINYKTTTAKLSDFKGKLLIIDFWDSYCASCIEAWPHMMDMQQRFGDQLQILLFNTRENESVVKKVFETRKKITQMDVTLPAICGDSVIKQLFPFTTVPHVIWIGKEGIVKAITAGGYVTEKNIRSVLNNEPVNLPIKDGVKYKVDFSKPLYINGNGGNGEHLLWQSVVSRYYPGLYGSTTIDSTYGFISNSTIVTMLRYLYKRETDRLGAQNYFPFGRISLEVKDTTKYVSKVNGELKYDNFYTYQLTSKIPVSKQRMKSLMLEDIKRYFGIQTHWEKRKKMCLVLSAKDTMAICYKGGETKEVVGLRNMIFDVNGITPQEMLDKLIAVTNEYHFSPYPILNETGMKGPLGNIQFEANVFDYAEFDKALQKYGMSFTLQERVVDILVITEQENL